MMIIVVIIAIIAACCMSSSAAAVMIYFSWADVSKFLGFASPAPATPPSFDNTVTPPVPKTEGGPPPTTPPVPKTGTPPPVPKTPPANPVTNPGDFSLANIEYKPVGDFKKDVLGTVNALRAIRNVSDPKPLKPIVPLTWDDELEAAACVHADINAKGSMHHPGVVMKGWEIIAWHDPATMGGVFAWWNEHTNKPNPAYPHVPTAWHCDPGNTACSDTGHESGDLATGHYAFMSHSDATRIGCCTSTAGTWAPLVCQGK
jgi:hypothetical protein